MDIPHIGTGESDAGVIGGLEHLGAGFGVLAIAIGPEKILCNQRYGFLCHGAGQLGGGAADISFHRVGQGIHAGGGGDLLRQAQRHMVIQHCRVRDQRKIVDGVFVVGSRIGDHSGQGGFAARARSGGNSDQQRRFAQDLQQAAHGLHCLLWTGDACAGGFSAVHGAAAAESDHGLRAALQIQCAALFHVVHSGVGHYAVVNCTGDSRLRKGFFQFLCKAQGAQWSVGDEQYTADVLPLQQGGDIRHCRQQFRLPVWQEGQRQAEADLIAAAEKPGKRIHKKHLRQRNEY